MVNIDELIALLAGTALLLFALAARARLRRVPRAGLLVASFLTLYLGWAATVAEGFVWPFALDLVEHLAGAAGALSLAAWCWQLGAPARRRGR